MRVRLLTVPPVKQVSSEAVRRVLLAVVSSKAMVLSVRAVVGKIIKGGLGLFALLV